MRRRGLRGLESRHEQAPGELLRDTRTMGQRMADFFRNPTAVAILLVMFAVAGFLLPGLADLLLIFGIVAFFIAYIQKARLPFRMPLHSHLLDYGDKQPGTNKPRKAGGIYFFGNEKYSNAELWFNNEDMRTHVLIFGSTGSGKTEMLISLAYNALLQGSGFIYVDGKGDNSLYAKVFSMVRSLGREDDLLLINFMTGARDIIGPQEHRLSNTMNPFARGSSSMLSQLVVSLMDSSSATPDGDMWKGRAIVFTEALMRALVAARDAGYILLDAHTIRRYFTIDRIEAMAIDKVLIRDGQEPVSLEGLPDIVLEPIQNYVVNLPGYNRQKKGKQVSQVLEQHGFITMQLTRAFGSLADTYGHILRTNLAEVDLHDVVLHRRILIVLLPALEKSPAELSNLGKVVIASLKAMMASGLGDEVEGSYRDLVERKPTQSPTPYLCILDEYGYYAVEGFAIVPAQARSLGFSVVFAGQDLPAFQKASKEEAASIGANTNIKIAMKLEDPIETWDFFAKTAGEAYVTHVSGFQTDSKSIMNQYMDTRSAQVEKRARVDLLDLKEQLPGEMHIFFGSKIVRAQVFYANPEPVPEMRLNQFLKVGIPLDKDIHQLVNGLQRFRQIIQDKNVLTDPPSLSEDIQYMVNRLQEETGKAPIECGVSALLAYRDRGMQAATLEEISVPENQLNMFTTRRSNDEVDALLLADDPAIFSRELLARPVTWEKIGYTERLAGKPENQARNVADEIIKDIQIATHYPPQVSSRPTGAELAKIVDRLVVGIQFKKRQKSTEGEGKAAS